MPTIREGVFGFRFPASWHAVKYDGEKDQPVPPNYYLRHLEPIKGVMAVDIVAAPASPAQRLILLEIKDFREDDADLQHKIETEHFPLEVVQKVLHTLSGLYLGVRSGDAELAPFSGALLGLSAVLEAVLFLEQAPLRRGPSDKGYKLALRNRTTQRLGIERRLKNALKPLGFRCALVDAGSVPASASWQVA